MNRWIGLGRLTGDPEVKYSSGEKSMAIARYILAVDETRKKSDGTRDTNFIPCVAFDKMGEFAGKYLQKGMKILVSGRIKTGSYTNKDGNKVYTTEIYVESQEFVESRQSSNQAQPQTQQNQGYQYQQNAAPQTQGYQYQNQQMPNPQYAPVQQTVTQPQMNQNYGYQMPQNPVPTAPPQMTNEQFMQIPPNVDDGSLPFN